MNAMFAAINNRWFKVGDTDMIAANTAIATADVIIQQTPVRNFNVTKYSPFHYSVPAERPS